MQVIIIGAGGLGVEVAWLAGRAGMEVVGLCDDAPDKASGTLAGRRLLGKPEAAAATLPPAVAFHVAIGDNRRRLAVAARATALGWRAVSIIDPSAIIAPDVVLGAGTLVAAGVVISCRTELAEHVIVNHHTSVGHDCRVADGAQLCPGVRLSGGCRVGSGALLGSNAVTIPGVVIGAWATLGAGAVALRDLADSERLVRLR